MSINELGVDHVRAKWVVDTLLDAWRRKLPPYDRIEEVPARLPTNLIRGGREEANYYFVCCYFMRGKINSGTALLKLAALHEISPWAFEPLNFRSLSKKDGEVYREKIQNLLKQGGLGFNSKENSKFWVINFIKLARFWKSNPLQFFTQASWEKLCKILIVGKGNPNFKTGFLGFREKMVGMYIYFLSRVNLIDRFTFPGVIDFHNDRVGLATEIIVGTRAVLGEMFTFEELSPLMREVFQKHAPDPETTLELADAIWHLSREFCKKSQGNSSKIGEYEARNTDVSAKFIKWSDSDIQRYYSSCGLCSLEEVCRYSIPSGENYNNGKIILRMERPKPHTSQEVLIQIERSLRSRSPLPKKVEITEAPHQHQISFVLFD